MREYPTPKKNITDAFIARINEFIKEENITMELIFLDEPFYVDDNNETQLTISERSLDFEYFIKQIKNRVKRGLTKLYFYELSHLSVILPNQHNEVDTYYVRWLFK